MNAITKIDVGDEIEVDRAKLTDSAVLVRREGVWIELRPSEADRELTIAIARLAMEPGDILVVKGPWMSVPDMSERNAMLKRMIPADVRILYIPPEVELSVLTKADIEARIGDGVALKSMAHPPGLIRKLARAIRDGRLSTKPPTRQ